MDERNQRPAATSSCGESSDSSPGHPPSIMLQTTQILELTRGGEDNNHGIVELGGSNPGPGSDNSPTLAETKTETETDRNSVVEPPHLMLRPTMILSLTADCSSSAEEEENGQENDAPLGATADQNPVLLIDENPSLRKQGAPEVQNPRLQHIEAENWALIARIMQEDQEAEEKARAQAMRANDSAKTKKIVKPEMPLAGQSSRLVPGATRVLPSEITSGSEATTAAPPLVRGRYDSQPGASRVRPSGREESEELSQTDCYGDTISVFTTDSVTVQGTKVDDSDLEEEIRQRIVGEAVAASIQKEFWTKRKLLCLGAFIAGLVVAIVGALVATRHHRGDSVSAIPVSSIGPTVAPSHVPTVFPSASSSFTENSKEILEILKTWNLQHGKALDDPSSPQYKSFLWLISGSEEADRSSLIRRYTLATLYYSTGGEDWLEQDSWLSYEHECDWLGISCDLSFDVVQLQLKSNNLKGIIPPELTYLVELQLLDFQDNVLSGSVPSELLSLSSLWSLDLGDNALTGTLPISDKFTVLVELHLGSNNFASTLSPLLKSLTSLERLDISKNSGITGSIPVEMIELTRLEEMDLSHLSLSGILSPLILSSLTNLQTLNLRSSGIDGTLSSSIGHVTKLEYLDISSNHVTGALPEELSLLTSLSELYLSGNPLNGTFPEFLSLFSSLEILEVVDTKLTSTLPTAMAYLQDLTVFECQGNDMTGPFPTEIGLMTNLEELRVTETFLTGPLPSELGRLTLLRKLKLDNNRFSGELPMELGDLESLSELSVFHNRFTGTIPQSLTLLESLAGASFALNNFTGFMPFCEEDGTPSLDVLVGDCEEISCPCCSDCCVDGGFCDATDVGN